MVFIPKNKTPGGLAGLTGLGDRAKILAMGLVLGLVLFLYFLPNHESVNPSVPRINREPANVEAFRPNKQTLAKVKDSTPSAPATNYKANHLSVDDAMVSPARAITRTTLNAT